MVGTSTHPGPLLPPSWDRKELHFPTPLQLGVGDEWQLVARRSNSITMGSRRWKIISLLLQQPLKTLVPDGIVTVLEEKILVIDKQNFGCSKPLGLELLII